VPRGLVIAALLFSGVNFGSAEGQNAIVTFYSHGSYLTSGLPGATHDIYIGSIFDGTQGMFSFLDSHIAHNNRYITLSFIPGPEGWAELFHPGAGRVKGEYQASLQSSMEGSISCLAPKLRRIWPRRSR
jgi:hypothetical protein